MYVLLHLLDNGEIRDHLQSYTLIIKLLDFIRWRGKENRPNITAKKKIGIIWFLNTGIGQKKNKKTKTYIGWAL